MKGIILAGGTGSRLMPLTQAFSKQLLPVYDKPMIYYPLSVLMLAGIKEILIITTESDQPLFKNLLGNGSNYGISLKYIIQDSPNGIASAFLLGEDFIGSDSVSLILGDNIFFGYQFGDTLLKAKSLQKGAIVFSTIVNNPSDFGVIEINEDSKILSIEEKPIDPKSNLALTGLYFYDNSVIDIAKNLNPSSRGELEITDVNLEYFKQGSLELMQLGRGFAWLDTGTNDALLAAGEFVSTIEKRQGLKIACLEEIAYNNEWIDLETLQLQVSKYKNSPYGHYLNKLSDQALKNF
jgi:glucose-1-phosphate thymidylyltransferase